MLLAGKFSNLPTMPSDSPATRIAFGEATGLRQRFDSIEQMAFAVRSLRPDREWSASQLSRGTATGRVIAFAGRDVSFTAGEIMGTVEVRGVVSPNSFVLGLGLPSVRGSLQWRQPVECGMALLMTPGEGHDGVYFGQSAYLAIDITHARLIAEGERVGLPLDPRELTTSRILPGSVDRNWYGRVSAMIAGLHRGQTPQLPPGFHAGDMLLEGMLRHLVRGGALALPRSQTQSARIVARARAVIDGGLDNPIRIDTLCDAAQCSRSVLYRAFENVLGESPISYVLKLRLNRIRDDLANPDEAMRTVSIVSARWGITEFGRLAGWYRAQFGETPSETLRRRQPRLGRSA